MRKSKLGEVEIDLGEIERLGEFAIIALLAYAIGNSFSNSLIASGYGVPEATVALWIAFFLVLLIYYKAIKIHLNINR
jgi:hypothetical protein